MWLLRVFYAIGVKTKEPSLCLARRRTGAQPSPVTKFRQDPELQRTVLRAVRAMIEK